MVWKPAGFNKVAFELGRYAVKEARVPPIRSWLPQTLFGASLGSASAASLPLASGILDPDLVEQGDVNGALLGGAFAGGAFANPYLRRRTKMRVHPKPLHRMIIRLFNAARMR